MSQAIDNTDNVPADVEPIVLVFSNKTITLSTDTAARIWDAVRRGEASSPQEYIHRAIEDWMKHAQSVAD